MTTEHQPTAAVIIIGNEVLTAKVQDTNGPFLIRALHERGVEVVETRVIPDTVPGIARAVQELASRVTHLLTTGGIGPTHDDVTMAGISQGLGVPVVSHPVLETWLRRRFPEGVDTARLKMTEVPRGAEVVLGDCGSVPVVRIGNVVILPGVPELMRLCFQAIASTMTGTPFCSLAIYLDARESEIAETLRQVQARHPEVLIGSYPRFDAAPYRVKVTVDSRDADMVTSVTDEIRSALDPAWLVDLPTG